MPPAVAPASPRQDPSGSSLSAAAAAASMANPVLGLGLAPPGAEPSAGTPPSSRRAPRLAKRRHAPASSRFRAAQASVGTWNPFGGGGGTDGQTRGFVFGAASPVSQQPSEPAVEISSSSEAPFVFQSVRENLPRFEEGLSGSSMLPDKMGKLNLRTSGEVGDGLGQGRDRKDGSSAFGVDISGLFSNKEDNGLQEKLTQLNLGHREPLQSEKRDSANGVPQAFVFGCNGAGSFADCKNTVASGAQSDDPSSVCGTDAKAMAGKSTQFNIGSQAPSWGGGIEGTNGAPEAFTFQSTAVSGHVDNINNVVSGANTSANTSSSTVAKGVGDVDLLPEKLTRLNIGSDMPLHESKSGYQPKVFRAVQGTIFGNETSSTSDRSSEFLSANSNTSSSSSDLFSTANSNTSNSANGTYCFPPEKTPDLNAGEGVMSESLESDSSNCPPQTFLFERNETRSSVSHSASIAMDDGGNFVNHKNTDTCSSARGTFDYAGALPEKMTKLNIGCRNSYHSRKDETATEPPEVFVFGCNVSSFSSTHTASKSHDPTTPEFCFQSKAEATSGYGAVPQTKVQESYLFTTLNNSCSPSTFENAVPAFSFGTMDAEIETAPDDHFSVKQDLPGFSRETLFGLDSIKSAYKDKREAHKGKMKNKRPTRLKQHAQLHQVISKEACNDGKSSDLAGDYSPMDCSPYPAEAEHVPTEAYVASGQPVHIGDSVISNWNTSCAEDDVVSATEHLIIDVNLPMFGDEGRGPKLDASESNFGSSFSSFQGDQSNGPQHSFTNIGQDCNDNTYRTPHDFVEPPAFQSSSSNFSGLNFRFGVSSSPQISAAAQRRNTRRKLRTKGSLASKPSTIGSFEQSKSSQDTKGMRFFCETSKNEDPVKEQPSRKSSTSAALEACETWRTSGNKAYENGHFATAEDYYTRGINSVTHYGVSGHCSRALMLCYSNRAATRMSLGMMWEALQDCLTATSIDPTFLKAKVRAANCHLALGDLEDALRSYMACLNSNTGSSSDPKILAEASDGLERVKGSDTLTMAKALSALLAEETRLNSLTSTGGNPHSVLAAAQKPKNIFKPCDHCGKTNHRSELCFVKFPDKLTDFRARRAARGRGPGPSNRGSVAVAATSSACTSESAWVLDSGASFHVTSDQSKLASTTPVTDGASVQTADGPSYRGSDWDWPSP
ncbi:serine-rich adhesin for platelets isoform X3 [Zea mays]|uniref:serine-rich adhesin for platelets isoform X3 n=1 Tax=Zea mays TaxID=4577 RepID=UPI0009AA61FF|nr:serine-rich adhesin for platelets isoform X3 [Zea mays]|eukprot:XP_020398027.1 uncharacterized protein LOC103635502 isoform X3 [Zea mays]